MKPELCEIAPAVNPLKQGKALRLVEKLERIIGTAPARGARLRAMHATASELRELLEDM
jgi:hypothetical protein